MIAEFSIENFFSIIHYELLAYFIKVFLANSEGTSQMLLTTHDINLLNEDFIRRDTIWFTDKDELGETQIVRLSSLGLHKNLSPYNTYKQGKLVLNILRRFFGISFFPSQARLPQSAKFAL